MSLTGWWKISSPFRGFAMAEPIPALSASFLAACEGELTALKPGNVHIHAAGHRMTVADFERSAEAAAPFIAMAGWKVGARIRAAMEATWQAVGCNTNLGILLLCAPLAVAAETGLAVAGVLAGLDRQDAADAFAAIARANPGGLGRAEEADVSSLPQITLLEAMRLAADRDRIAANYANAYADIFDLALPAYRDGLARFGAAPEAVTHLYLTLLRAFPDTHVARKYGPARAQELQREVSLRFPAYHGRDDHAALLAFDAELKASGINPGTAADLTVATLFSHNILSWATMSQTKP